MSADDIAHLRSELERLGRKREQHRARAAALSDEIEPLVHRAHHKAGIPIAELARITGMGRPTIQAMVRGRRRW